MERKNSRINLSTTSNDYSGEQRKNSPLKNPNRTSGSSIEVPSPLTYNNDSPFSKLVELYGLS
jgi:hypothetical protein